MPRPDSIKTIGLEKYLDRTAEEHNGFNYRDYKRMREAKVSRASRARAMNVTPNTIDKWDNLDAQQVG